MSSFSNTSSVIDVNEDENNSSLSSNRRSEVYNFFTLKSLRWYCNYCSKNFADKSTSTLWRHVSKIHPKIVEAYKEREQQKVGAMDKYTVSNKIENVSDILIILIDIKILNNITN